MAEMIRHTQVLLFGIVFGDFGVQFTDGSIDLCFTNRNVSQVFVQKNFVYLHSFINKFAQLRVHLENEQLMRFLNT